MSELVARLPHAEAVACLGTVGAHARLAKADGDQRPVGVLRAKAMRDLLLRPWATDRPQVTAHLDILAPLSALVADPSVPNEQGTVGGVAEVAGEPVTASHLRALLEALDAVCPGGVQPPTGGTMRINVLGGDGALLSTLTRPQLERAARRGCADHPIGDCRCPLVGRPPAADGYERTAAQERYVAARDRTCRHPGCGTRAGWADLDHVLPHGEGGATGCDNLCCLCRRHHRLKTFAPGWVYRLEADGTLLVSSPTGVTRISRPPGMHLLDPYDGTPTPAELLAPDPPPF
jgi:hypothetical protein